MYYDFSNRIKMPPETNISKSEKKQTKTLQYFKNLFAIK